MQNGGLRQQAGNHRWGSLVGPLSRQSDRAFLLIEKRKDFAAADAAPLQDQKPLA